MSYWKWLGNGIRSVIRHVTSRTAIEAYGGLIGAIVFFFAGIGFGRDVDSVYYLLLLGIIPSILVMLYGIYKADNEL